MYKPTVIIGNGISSKMMLFYLIDKLDEGSSIIHIFDHKIARPCSLNTTGIVCQNGIEKGVSDLGDLLHDSFFEFKMFYETYGPSGLIPSKIYHLYSDQKKEMGMRRFKKLESFNGINNLSFKNKLYGVIEDGFLVNAPKFLDWLDQLLKNKIHDKNIDYKSIEDLVIKIDQDQNKVELLKNNHINYKKLYAGIGAYTKVYQKLFGTGNECLNKLKVVPGSYYESYFDLGGESFCLTIDGHNLVYIKEDKKILIGATTNSSLPDGLIATDDRGLKEIKSVFDNLVNEKIYENLIVKTGLRHKGRKRTPFIENISEDITVFAGTYKNGWSVPFLLGKNV